MSIIDPKAYIRTRTPPPAPGGPPMGAPTWALGRGPPPLITWSPGFSSRLTISVNEPSVAPTRTAMGTGFLSRST